MLYICNDSLWFCRHCPVKSVASLLLLAVAINSLMFNLSSKTTSACCLRKMPVDLLLLLWTCHSSIVGLFFFSFMTFDAVFLQPFFSPCGCGKRPWCWRVVLILLFLIWKQRCQGRGYLQLCLAQSTLDRSMSTSFSREIRFGYSSALSSF